MSESVSTPAAPARRYNWLKIALVASLAVNLLFVGGGIARWYMAQGPERMSRGLQSQLIPRRFFMELEQPRRAELLAVFRNYDKPFREGRRAVRDQLEALAVALDADPYDPARVNAALAGFTARSEGLLEAGGNAALTLIGKLTPGERKMLAQQLRQRGRPAAEGKSGSKPANP